MKATQFYKFTCWLTIHNHFSNTRSAKVAVAVVLLLFSFDYVIIRSSHSRIYAVVDSKGMEIISNIYNTCHQIK